MTKAEFIAAAEIRKESEGYCVMLEPHKCNFNPDNRFCQAHMEQEEVNDGLHLDIRQRRKSL
jgi:hypothetical protein